MKILRIIAILLLSTGVVASSASANEVQVTSPQLPQKFFSYATSSKLEKPGILIVDSNSKTDLYNVSGDQAHIPASVFKLVSTFTALNILTAERKFATAVFATTKNRTIVIQGSRDPWLTSTIALAKKNGQVYLPGLIAKSKPMPTTIEYSGLFANDIKDLKSYFSKRHIKVTLKSVTAEQAQADSTDLITSAESVPVFDMVKFAVLWSDNQLADRLVREAARHENLATDQAGLQRVVETSLRVYGISTEKMFVVDGAGLAKENMVTPRTIAQVLTVIRNNPNFQAIYQGLPVSGETGTLMNRFITTGTNAIGLVRAKTGWLNSVVSLAGYVTSGKNEYVFVIIADGITPGFKYRNRARETIYSLLETIAAPAN